MRSMKTMARGAARGLAIAMFAFGTAHAQPKPAPSAPAYVPEVGQEGKDVVWVPTGQVLVDKMLDMAKLTPQDILYDLGSGDGRTVITAAKRGTRAYGIEFNPDMVALSRRNAERAGVAGRATFLQGDIFASDFSKATVVTLFLLPELNLRLRPTLLNMKPGTRVLANSFNMEDWRPDQTAQVEGDCDSWCTAYLWIVPATVGGKWKLADGTLDLKQEFQNFTGTLTRDGKRVAVTGGKIDGERVSFSAAGARYSARVNGKVMEGTFGAAKTAWRAQWDD